MTMYWIAYKCTDPFKFEGTMIVNMVVSPSTPDGFTRLTNLVGSLLNNESVQIIDWKDAHDKELERTLLIEKVAQALYTCWAATVADTIVLETVTDRHGFRYLSNQSCDELLDVVRKPFDQQNTVFKDQFIEHAKTIASIFT